MVHFYEYYAELGAPAEREAKLKLSYFSNKKESVDEGRYFYDLTGYG